MRRNLRRPAYRAPIRRACARPWPLRTVPFGSTPAVRRPGAALHRGRGLIRANGALRFEPKAAARAAIGKAMALAPDGRTGGPWRPRLRLSPGRIGIRAAVPERPPLVHGTRFGNDIGKIGRIDDGRRRAQSLPLPGGDHRTRPVIAPVPGGNVWFTRRRSGNDLEGGAPRPAVHRRRALVASSRAAALWVWRPGGAATAGRTPVGRQSPPCPRRANPGEPRTDIGADRTAGRALAYLGHYDDAFREGRRRPFQPRPVSADAGPKVPTSRGAHRRSTCSPAAGRGGSTTAEAIITEFPPRLSAADRDRSAAVRGRPGRESRGSTEAGGRKA